MFMATRPRLPIIDCGKWLTTVSTSEEGGYLCGLIFGTINFVRPLGLKLVRV